MHTIRHYLLLGCAMTATILILLTSCENHTGAAAVVKDFMKENVVNANDIHDLAIVAVDTTKLINDSTMQAVHQVASQAKHMKKDIHYGKKWNGGKLVYVIVRYKLGQQDINETYYLDETTSHVVGVKTN